MAKITMLTNHDHKVLNAGTRVVRAYKKGQTYTVVQTLADDFVAAGVAKIAKVDKPASSDKRSDKKPLLEG